MSVIIYQLTLRPIRKDVNVLKNNSFQEVSEGSDGKE